MIFNPSIIDREMDFIISNKLKFNERFVRYLLLGMVADFDRGREGFEYFIQRSIEGKEKYGPKYPDDLSDQELFPFIYDLLCRIVMEKIKSLDQSVPLTLGVSSGYDSRSILMILLIHKVPIITYTYGQAGNFDYDFAKLLFKKIDRENIFFDTSRLNWSLKEYERGIIKFQDYPISPRVITEQFLGAKHDKRYDLQGYLNDSLTGPRISLFGSNSWELALDHFCRENNQFKLQSLVSKPLVKSLLPEKPFCDQDIISLDRQLNFAFRQLQRIRPPVGKGSPFILPFEDHRWVSFWLSRTGESVKGQRLYLKFLKHLQELVFFDINNNLDKDRKELKRHNIRSMYGGLNFIEKAYAQYIQKEIRPKKPSAHFCLYTCYCNNESFRGMLNESIERLKKRKVFKENFIDSVFRDFLRADATSASMLNGLVSADMLIEAGFFDE